MKKIPLLAALMTLAGLASAEALRMPPLGSKEHGSISTTDKEGKYRWKADWTMSILQEGGKKQMHFDETGEGYKSEFGRQVKWRLAGVWSLGERVSPLTFEEEVRDDQDRVLQTERKVFSPEKGWVTIETKKPLKGSDKKREVEIPSDILNQDGLGTILRALPFDPPKALTTHLLAGDNKVYEISLEPRGIERIKNAGGEYDCYKVELVPHLGVLNVFKAFVPKTYFWFTVAPPHFFVRYEGLESGLGTPHVLLNVVKFETLAQ